MSTSPVTEEIRQLSERVAEFPPPRRLPTSFLSLAPSTSDSYPRTQRVKDQQQPESPTATTAPTEQPVTTAVLDTETLKRRTSSMSSDGTGSRLRFLKLGPVHWGEHQDGHNADFHEVAVE